MKKYSWIVALLLALTFTFIGCGVDPLPDPDAAEEEYEIVELGDFNYINNATQSGWATDGHNEAKFKAGLTLEDFRAAKYLVLECDQPKGGVQFIWGINCENDADLASFGFPIKGPAAPNTGWLSTDITSGTGTPDVTKGASYSNGELKVELSKALLSYADIFFSDKLTAMKVLFAYYSSNLGDLNITGAYLMIPNEETPFVPVTEITLTSALATLTDTDYKLEAAVAPLDASKRTITWAYDKTTTGPNQTFVFDTDWKEGGSAYWSDTDPIMGEKPVIDNTYPFSEGAEPVIVPAGISKDSFNASVEGKVTFRAIVKGGLQVLPGDVGKNLQDPPTGSGVKHASTFKGSDESVGKDGWVTAADVGKFYDFVSLPITITVLQPFEPSFTTADITGEKGDISAVSATGFTYTSTDGNATSDGPLYENNYACFKVDFGTGKKLSDFTGVSFTFQGTQGDIGYKPLELWASASNITGSQGGDPAAKLDLQIHAATVQYTNGSKDLQLDFNSSKITTALDQQVVFFVIYIGMDERPWSSTGDAPIAHGVYSISNIQFVPSID